MATTALDPYAALGVPRGASRDEAARAHRRLAKEFHPDLNPGPQSAERMRRVNEAWWILSDPTRRARYDALTTPRAASGSGYGYRPQATTSTWTTWPEDRYSAPRQRRPARAAPVQPSFGDRPAVVVAVSVTLGLLYFIGSWLGSIGP
jgi:curved DNA-binding protein CbpA